MSDDEKVRKKEEDQARWEYDDENDFDALQDCGHRSPGDLLDEEEYANGGASLDDHFVWSVAGRKARTYFWMIEHLDIDEVTQLYAIQRTDLYLELEDSDGPTNTDT